MWKIDILQQHQKDCLTTMWKILEYIRIREYKYKSDTENEMLENIGVKDISFKDFQQWIWKWIEVLDSNNNKWRKQSR